MRIVVTRPQEDSERTAAALRERGHIVVVAPLLRVEHLPLTLAHSYGAVVINSANAMAATTIAEDYAPALLLCIGILAGLDEGIYRVLGDVGWLSVAGVHAGLALAASASLGGPPGTIACAALMAAFVVMALYHGTVLSAQLAIHQQTTDNFADGVVCIEHPCFALALIEVLTLTNAPTELVPPIVTG